MASLGIGLAHGDVVRRDAGVRDERFHTVDHVFVAVAHGCGIHRCDVAAVIGLRDCSPRDSLTLGDRSEVHRLLLVGSVVQDVLGREVCDHHSRADARVTAAKLLDHERVLEAAISRATVFLGEMESHKTFLTRPLPDLRWKLVLRLQLECEFLVEFSLGKLESCLLYVFLCLSQFKMHF